MSKLKRVDMISMIGYRGGKWVIGSLLAKNPFPDKRFFAVSKYV
jgi:hypothetical protein